MMSLPVVGSQPLKQAARYHNHSGISVSVVRDLNGIQKVTAIRALTYMAEQDCPFEEEFDGNDFCALHLIAADGQQPVGTLRLRFFAGFCKIERVCIVAKHRGGAVLNHLMAHAFEIAARKGYRTMIAHMQLRLRDMWDHVMECRVLDENSIFSFSGVEYVTLEIPVPDHPDALRLNHDPYVLLRPEGAWDEPGVLEPKEEAA